MPTLRLGIGFVDAASTSTILHLDDVTRGKLGTGTLGSSDVFTDCTADLRSFTTRRGSSRTTGAVISYDAGTASFEMNDNDRDYDPDNLSGPYVAAGVTLVTPMRAIRIQAVYASVTYDLFRGFADSWNHVFDGPRNTIVTVPATDATKVLAAISRTAVAPVGASELTGARITRVLDSASWPASDRVIDTGNTTLQATTLEGNPWEEAQLANRTEIGELYIDGAGRVVFRRRTGVLEDTRSLTSNATFGDGGGSELPYESVTMSYDDVIYNEAKVTREGGTEQSASDSTSIASYLTHTMSDSGLLMENDAAALDYANWIVYQGKDPERRVETITLTRNATSATEDLLFPQMLGRDIGDRITVKIRPPGVVSTITRDYIIRGIEHQWAPGTWKTRWTLQSATKFTFLVLNDATLGRLNLNAIAY